MTTQKALFAAGCFWGVEETFRQTAGVVATRVGYAGGNTPEPTYQQVCTGATGHAETVEVIFDPQQISFEQLLEVFWKAHDPSQVNRQGPDVGTQYRSAIFVQNDEQRQQALAAKQGLETSGRFRAPIATEIADPAPFYPAEDYHQQYLAKRGRAACASPHHQI